MNKVETAEKIGAAALRGSAREKVGRARDRFEESTDRFKTEAAGTIEGLADQIRELGDRFDRQGEANALARRLERSADYLRYRPSAEVAGDALAAVRESRLLWILGGMLAGALVYRLVRTSDSA